MSSRIRSIIGGFGLEPADEELAEAGAWWGLWPTTGSSARGEAVEEGDLGDLAALQLANSGFSPSSSEIARSAVPKCSGEMPISSCSARKGGQQRRRQDAAEVADDRLDLSHRAGHLVVTEPLAPLDRPAKEGDPRRARRLDRDRVDQRAGAAQRARPPRRRPELEGDPPLHPVLAVLGREQRLLEDRPGRVGVAEDRRGPLLAVAVAARRGAADGQRQQAAVGEDDADRAALDLARVLLMAAAYWL